MAIVKRVQSKGSGIRGFSNEFAVGTVVGTQQLNDFGICGCPAGL